MVLISVIQLYINIVKSVNIFKNVNTDSSVNSANGVKKKSKSKWISV